MPTLRLPSVHGMPDFHAPTYPFEQFPFGKSILLIMAGDKEPTLVEMHMALAKDAQGRRYSQEILLEIMRLLDAEQPEEYCELTEDKIPYLSHT